MEQEALCQIRTAEPSLGLAVARRGEIEQAETLEERGVSYVRMECPDQSLGDVKFDPRDKGMDEESALPLHSQP